MQQMAKATTKKVYSLLLTAATVVTFPIAPLSWFPIWKHPRWGTFRKVILAIMSLACTMGLVTFVIVKKGAADKAVASANAEWDKENQEEAITQYRSLLPNSGFLGKEEQARVYRRLIEFDVGHDNKESARQLIEKADDRNLELNLTEPRATEMLAEYQQKKREEVERRKQEEAEKAASKAVALRDAAEESSPDITYSVSKGVLQGSVRVVTGGDVGRNLTLSGFNWSGTTLKCRVKWNAGEIPPWRYNVTVYDAEGNVVQTTFLNCPGVLSSRHGDTIIGQIHVGADAKGAAKEIRVHM
jgi:hypothetical protein